MTTFEKYMQEKGEELRPWQKEVAAAFLIVMHKRTGTAQGKTFLMQNLAKFIEQHGNDFEV